MITAGKLAALMPKCTTRAEEWVEAFEPLAGVYGINNVPRQAAFFANVAVESDELTRLVENLNYSSTTSLLMTFPKHFSGEDDAAAYVHNPEKTANRVYANRMGNGGEQYGDGWRYRGRGLFQLTGKAEYEAYAKYRQIDAVGDPSLLEQPQYAADSAAWYFAVFKSLNHRADVPDFQYIVRAINGGLNGWMQRKKYYDLALSLLE